MIKCTCDKCNKEINVVYPYMETANATNKSGVILFQYCKARRDLCDECNDKFKKLNLDIADFMAFPDKEIDFLLNTFSVGDKVITADGREGVIISVCTCDRCKERGFYEPTVRFDDGEETYITYIEKEYGFEEYYQIGDHIFGNLDEYNVIAGIERCEQQLAQWRKQLALVERLGRAKENNNGN